jgi:hypothetical protein
VPLPASPALDACRSALDTCMTEAAGSDPKACFDAHHACVQAAFDAAKAAASTAN